MTRQEWFAATEPDTLLALVDPRPIQVEGVWQAPPPRPSMVYRRLRLFATACARTVWPFLTTEARSAVAISERFAGGKATETDLRAAFIPAPWNPRSPSQHAVFSACAALALTPNPEHDLTTQRIQSFLSPRDAARSAAFAQATSAAGPLPSSRPTPPKWHKTWNTTYLAARAVQADIVRDIFPPPGFIPYLREEWRTSTVVAIAQQMDELGEYSAVPILADALEDAGCDSEMVLQCCRAPGNVHVLGNWVVDLVLDQQ